MAIKMFQLIAFAVLFFLGASSDIFDRILSDVSPCAEVCRNTYSPHTNDIKVGVANCCERGCRLFSMMEFVYDDFNKTLSVCLDSCAEAYPKKDELESCNLGCRSQKPYTVDQQETLEEMGPSVHMMYPFMYIHRLYSDLISNVVSRSMSVSVYMYRQDPDGSVMVVKSAPRMEFVNLNKDFDDIFDDDYKTSSYMETNLEPMDNSATPMGKHSQLHARPRDDDGISLSSRDLRSDRSGTAEATDWLSCIARKSGLPRLLLSWLLLMCAVVMIWLCLSAAVTSPEHKCVTEPQKLSINGDQEVIAELLAQGIKPSYPQETVGGDVVLPIKLKVQRI